MKMTRVVLIAIPMIVGIIAAVVDTQPYRDATRTLTDASHVEAVATVKQAVDADFARFHTCDAARKLDPATQMSIHSPEWRACLLKEAPQVHTVPGALVMAAASSGWLADHPDDAELQAALLKSLDRGWAALRAEKPMYEELETVAQTHDASRLLRLFDGAMMPHTPYTGVVESLERAELQVSAPVLARRQYDRRRQIAFGV